MGQQIHMCFLLSSCESNMIIPILKIRKLRDLEQLSQLGKIAGQWMVDSWTEEE